MLEDAGVIQLTSERVQKEAKHPVLEVLIDNSITVMYDTFDGLNWIRGSREENLNYFRDHYKADFYFKRSYIPSLQEYAPEGCTVCPLGLNYNMKPGGKSFSGTRETFKILVKKLLRKTITNYPSSFFEFYPIMHNPFSVLFYTRLLDPDSVELESFKKEREELNRNRIAYIRGCRKELGNSFTGGVIADDFSQSFAKDILVPSDQTALNTYIQTIKQNTICIATTGLHGSVPWKIGLYLAASRAIVTEPLCYTVPGDFKENKNYLSFSKEDELIEQLIYLRQNPDLVRTMMRENYSYYHTYLRPDMLVLRTLLIVRGEFEVPDWK